MCGCVGVCFCGFALEDRPGSRKGTRDSNPYEVLKRSRKAQQAMSELAKKKKKKAAAAAKATEEVLPAASPPTCRLHSL